AHEPERATAYERELGVPDGVEALDRGQADPLRAEGHLVGADGTAVDRDFAGRAHGTRADRRLELFDANPRGRERQPALHVTDHERQIANRDQPPADRAASQEGRLLECPSEAHVEVELARRLANLLTQD